MTYEEFKERLIKGDTFKCNEMGVYQLHEDTVELMSHKTYLGEVNVTSEVEKQRVYDAVNDGVHTCYEVEELLTKFATDGVGCGKYIELDARGYGYITANMGKGFLELTNQNVNVR